MAKSKKKSAKKESKRVVKEVEKKAVKKEQPGVIASILEYIQVGPVSKKHIVSKLTKRFPDHKSEALAATVNAQLPNRMAKERKIKIVVKDGKYSVKK